MTTVPYGARTSALGLLQDVAERHPFPLSAIVQLTRRCNLSCRHCYQAGQSGTELTTAEWETVFRRLADASVLFLTLTGGEPIVRDDLVELVRIARGLTFAVKLKTNGFGMTPELCDALAAAPVMEVHFSFYATDPALHDRVTGQPGSQAVSLAAARRLRAAGVRVVLNCPLMNDTFDGYPEVIDFAVRESMEWSLDPGIQVQEDGCSGPARYRITGEQLDRLLGDVRVFQSHAAPPRESRLARTVCNVGKAMVAVAPNGDVWPCLSLVDPIGNLLTQTLPEIWLDNPKLRRYADLRWQDLPECRSCEWMCRCSRCHAQALLEDGNLLGPSKLACGAAQARARVAERLSSAGLAELPGSSRLAAVAQGESAAGGSAPGAPPRG